MMSNGNPDTIVVILLIWSDVKKYCYNAYNLNSICAQRVCIYIPSNTVSNVESSSGNPVAMQLSSKWVPVVTV